MELEHIIRLKFLERDTSCLWIPDPCGTDHLVMFKLFQASSLSMGPKLLVVSLLGFKPCLWVPVHLWGPDIFQGSSLLVGPKPLWGSKPVCCPNITSFALKQSHKPFETVASILGSKMCLWVPNSRQRSKPCVGSKSLSEPKLLVGPKLPMGPNLFGVQP